MLCGGEPTAWRRSSRFRGPSFSARSTRLAIAGKDQAAREQALADVSAVNEAAAIPYLEAGVSTNNEDGALAVVQALAKLRQQLATDSLVRHAILCNRESVRTAASTLSDSLSTPVSTSRTPSVPTCTAMLPPAPASR